VLSVGRTCRPYSRGVTRLPAARDAAVAALTAPSSSALVDLVAYPDGDGEPAGAPSAVVVANAGGAVRLHADGRHEVLHGHDPVACTDPLAFLPYRADTASLARDNAANAYPDPARRLRCFFADPSRSPDLVVVHTPAHYFPGEGGHHGEHGSLDAVQSRAPLLVAGAGAARGGVVTDHARVIDVAPTLLRAAGVPVERHRDAAGDPLDGRERADLVAEPGAGRYVVGILWDGAPCGELLHLAASGALPGVARLLEHGTALAGGAVAEFPSVTLCNHTSALTGVGPGRHGVLGNVFYDRATGLREVPNDASTWHRSARWLRPGVATVFEQLAAARPGALSACINEPVDRGSAVSTMQQIRSSGAAGGAGELDAALPAAEGSRFVGEAGHLADPSYRWGTRVDDLGLAQLLQVFAEPGTAPALTWWNNVVTDSGHHAGGPGSAIARDSLRDADRRLQAFLDHLDRLGIAQEVTFLLTADHGFEASDPQVTGSWAPVLHGALDPLGVDWRDEGPGAVYLGVPGS
jgi:phosphonoacetate hydrolase